MNCNNQKKRQYNEKNLYFIKTVNEKTAIIIIN